MTTQIRVLMVDDYPLLREGAERVLREAEDIVWLGFIDHFGHLERVIEELKPTVLLYSTRRAEMIALTQLEAVCRHFPHLKILLLVDESQTSEAIIALTRGGDGILLKRDPQLLLETAIRAVHGGQQWISPTVQGHPDRSDPARVPLALREQQLLSLVARGWDNTTIAAEVGLAEQTVRNYLTRVYHKLGVSSRAEAILYALHHGMGPQIGQNSKSWVARR